jgi:hypothetical protein
MQNIAARGTPVLVLPDASKRARPRAGAGAVGTGRPRARAADRRRAAVAGSARVVPRPANAHTGGDRHHRRGGRCADTRRPSVADHAGGRHDQRRPLSTSSHCCGHHHDHYLTRASRGRRRRRWPRRRTDRRGHPTQNPQPAATATTKPSPSMSSPTCAPDELADALEREARRRALPASAIARHGEAANRPKTLASGPYLPAYEP